LLIAGMRALAGFGGVTSRREEANGQPGVLFFDREGGLISVAILDVADGQIQGVSTITNPDKLRHLGPVADVSALLRERGRPGRPAARSKSTARSSSRHSRVLPRSRPAIGR
jgi:hypothetical protein